MRAFRAVVRILGGSLLLVLLLATPAGAHDPIFIDEQTVAAESPIIGDGTISFATYGVIEEPDGVAHVRLELADGDPFHIEVLVPDQPPENELDDFSHLTLTVTAPDGSATQLPGGSIIDRYDEPFTGTAYLRVAELDTPAAAGTHAIAITSARPTRFTVATGRTERFGTEVANYERRSLDAVTAWYATPPPRPAPTSTVAPSTTTVAPTTAPPPPSTDGEATTPTTPTPPTSEPNEPGTEAAAASVTEPSDGSQRGATLAVLAAAVAALLAAGWWLRRRSARE